MVRVTIDGITSDVDKHLSVLQAARSLSIDIPTLCYHKKLSPCGACRICLVEIEGNRRLVAACVTPVMNNMVVKTRTEKVLKARKANLELILARHPTDCLICEKGGECDLQKVSFKLGVSKQEDSAVNRMVDIFGVQPLNLSEDDTRTIIERDLNKCILCKKCVRICKEIQGVGAISFAKRGYDMSLGTFYGNALDCEFCGQCVDVCPVGALFSRLNKYKARPWQLQDVESTCPYCAVGCSINLHFKNEEVVRVTAGEGGVNDGLLCAKGRYGFSFISDESRLSKPLVKKDMKFTERDWDVALDLVSNGIKNVVEKYGADSVYGIGSARCTNEENYLFQKFMRGCVGTNNIDTCARFEHAASIGVINDRLGFPAATNTSDEVKGADVILLVGCNVTETHPILGTKIKSAVNNDGAKLIVVEPRSVKISRFSHIDVNLLPGTDSAFINAVIKVIIDEKLYSDDFIKNSCTGFSEFKSSVSKLSIKELSASAGVSEELVRETARLYAKADKAMILFGMGVTQYKNVDDNVDALINLALITGNIGKKHSGIIPLRGQNNIQGACDMGVTPNYLPGYVPVEGGDGKDGIEKEWGFKVPDSPGLALSELIDAIIDGKIKALYVMGENPLLSSPDINKVKRALASLELLVVQDMVKSETAEMAHVILPVSSFAEKDGTYTNMDRKVQRVTKAIEPRGESKPDWEILSLLMKRMGMDNAYWHPSEIIEEVRRLVPMYAGVFYGEMKNTQVQWSASGNGADNKGFIALEDFDKKTFELKPVDFSGYKKITSDKYPFLFLTGKGLFHYHTGTMTRSSEELMDISHEGLLEINPEDASELDLKEGEKVKVASPSGEIDIVVKITEHSPKGMLYSTVHFRESAVNYLMDDSYAGSGKTPNLKVCPVNIQKVA